MLSIMKGGMFAPSEQVECTGTDYPQGQFFIWFAQSDGVRHVEVIV